MTLEPTPLTKLELRLLLEVERAKLPVIASSLHLTSHYRKAALLALERRGLLILQGNRYFLTQGGIALLTPHRQHTLAAQTRPGEGRGRDHTTGA